MSEPLARLEVVVPGPVVPLNRTYLPTVRRTGVGPDAKSFASMAKTAGGKRYFQQLRFATLRAMQATRAWPRDPWQVTAARLSVYLYDTKVDVGAATKAVGDAAEGILFENDRIVALGEQPRPIMDGSGTRLVAVYELLAIDPPDVAAARRTTVLAARWKRQAARVKKRRLVALGTGVL